MGRRSADGSNGKTARASPGVPCAEMQFRRRYIHKQSKEIKNNLGTGGRGEPFDHSRRSFLIKPRQYLLSYGIMEEKSTRGDRLTACNMSICTAVPAIDHTHSYSCPNQMMRPFQFSPINGLAQWQRASPLGPLQQKKKRVPFDVIDLAGFAKRTRPSVLMPEAIRQSLPLIKSG